MDFWLQFEGELIDSQYRLQRFVGANDTGATFIGRAEHGDEDILVKIVRYGSKGWESASRSWAIAKELNHPNLIRVFASRVTSLGGLRVAYAITENPDGFLSAVLAERHLSAEEAEDVVVSCAEALRFLHQRGLVHANVNPASICAVGTNTKFTADRLELIAGRKTAVASGRLYAAPEQSCSGSSPATDISALGVTLYEALTGSQPSASGDVDNPAIPERLRDILEHTLEPDAEQRWTAQLVLDHLGHHSRARDKVEVKRGYRNALAVPPRFATPTILGLLVSGALGVLVMGIAMIPSAPRTPQPVIQASMPKETEIHIVPAAPPADSGTAQRQRTPEPDPPLKKAPPATAPTPRAAKAAQHWRVIVYSYSHANRAQQKAEAINKEWPDLRAEVLPSGSAHVVAIGGRLDEKSAETLRLRILARGFPKDTFIERMSN